MPSSPRPSDLRPEATLGRRRFLQLGAAGIVVVGAGAFAGSRIFAPPDLIGPRSAAVTAGEAARRTTGHVVRRELRAAPTTIDLAGRTVHTWAYNDTVPGPEIRVQAGDELRVRLINDLPAPTSVHWHGIDLRNDMDGVPGLTQAAVAPAGSFDYAFIASHPGTYWFHPHVGVQLDTGLQGALIVEDPAEAGAYDEEVVLVLDDWTDGWGDSPDAILARMTRDGMTGGSPMAGMSMGGTDGGGMSMAQTMPSGDHPLGTDTGDVVYPSHLINGRPPQDPFVISTAPGRRIRLRLINAGSDTAYRFAIGGHRLTVTHADGYPVVPIQVDTLIVGMGERYDVVVTAGDGAFPVVAVAEGKATAAGSAVLRTASGAVPPTDARPTELSGRLLAYADLAPTDASAMAPRTPDRTLELALQMVDGGRKWFINGAGYGNHRPLDIRAGERVRLLMRNESMMFHPMHIHGHTFALTGATAPGIRKDTVNVLPMQTVAVDLQADNPGQWAVHCHNTYHAELGMMSVLSYLA
ncbi:copper resistance protein A precursor [mine drainage metagenome]|uniref:Copper resistance protein A n=1 Tax=mine drainage metagenome TaxID=410659 RepID=A0A1J5QIR9_9ZZZZ